MCANKFDLKSILELIDPVVWLEAYTGFKPYPYQAKVLRDYKIRLRVIRKSRQIGMTTAVAQEAIWKAYTGDNRVILIVSPSDRQSKILMNKITATIGKNRKLLENVVRRNRNELELSNGSVIISLPNNPDRLRGFSATDIYLDEAAHFLNDGPVMAAIRPMLIATNGSFTIISTPFGKRGLFWDQYRIAVHKRKGAKAYDLCPSTICPLITKERMQQERENLTELEFKQEYLGEFIEQVDVYLPLDLIQSCVDPNLVLRDTGESNKQYILGADFAKRRDETVVILLEEERLGRDSAFVVRHISAWAGMDYSEQVGRISRLTETFRVICGAADQSGVGEPVIEDLRTIIPQLEGIRFSAEWKAHLASTLRSFLEQGKIRLPDNKRLIMQLNGLTYKVSKTGKFLFDSPEKLHDDFLWALTLACYAASQLEKIDRQKPIIRFGKY
jgi:phage FluMu gp28-like protein